MTPFRTNLPEPGSIAESLYPPSSRYYGLPVKQLAQGEESAVAYLGRRFVPPVERFVTVYEHRVIEGEQLDNIAAKHLGDPEQFWRLCDANGVLNPSEMTEQPGRRLRITLPEGIPGVTHA